MLFKSKCGFIRKTKRAVCDLEHLAYKSKDLKIPSDILDSVCRHHVLPPGLRGEMIFNETLKEEALLMSLIMPDRVMPAGLGKHSLGKPTLR